MKIKQFIIDEDSTNKVIETWTENSNIEIIDIKTSKISENKMLVIVTYNDINRNIDAISRRTWNNLIKLQKDEDNDRGNLRAVYIVKYFNGMLEFFVSNYIGEGSIYVANEWIRRRNDQTILGETQTIEGIVKLATENVLSIKSMYLYKVLEEYEGLII